MAVVQALPPWAPCTGENDPMGSSMKKNDNMGAKTVPRGAKFHCHFSMDEPIGSFSPVQGDGCMNPFVPSVSHYWWSLDPIPALSKFCGVRLVPRPGTRLLVSYYNWSLHWIKAGILKIKWFI